MPEIGQTISHYQIIKKLGEGGMGEVFLAKDMRLDRSVAIKVLPAHLSADPERRARFAREAKTIAGLNHANICTLHDVGETDGATFLVLEHLTGETLAQRLEKGPLPLEQVFTIGMEIADALSTAHRQGVIHRDLKPGNVMLTKSGAKLLDFGLAKLKPAGPVGLEATSAPTQDASVTVEGVLLGTLPYMAPEQIEGRDADARTDLWALGCVLFEMVAGRRAFAAKSQASLIGAIMMAEPPSLPVVQPLAPAALDHMVRACLAKDPDERWQSAADVKRELRWIAEQRLLAQTSADGQSGMAATVAAVARKRSLKRVLGLVAAVAVLVTAGVAVTWLATNRPAPVAEPVHFTIQLPDNVTLDRGGSASSNPGVISPDGRQIAFVANDQLCVRSLGLLEVRGLAGTDGAFLPFWAPDSRRIGYFAKSKLWQVDASGGTPMSLGDALQGRGGTWNHDGVIVAARDISGPLVKFTESGSAPTALTTLDKSRGERSHRWPQFLPDGKHFLYLAFGTPNAIFVGSLDPDEPRKLLIDNAGAAAFYAEGYLLFSQGNNLAARPFDVERLSLRGTPLRLLENVATDSNIGGSSGRGITGFSVSVNGSLTYRSVNETSVLALVDRASGAMTPIIEPGFYLDPAVSPDGKRVAFARRDSSTGANDVWILELAGSRKPWRFTYEGGTSRAPLWSRDGTAIIFASSQDRKIRVYRKSAIGLSSRALLFESDARTWGAYSWAPDGTLLGLQSEDLAEDIFALPNSPDSRPVVLMRTPAGEGDPSVSPDGKWLLYASTKLGQWELFIQSYPSLSGETPITSDGGVDPIWSRSGKEIFYVNPNSGALMSIPVDMGTPPRVGIPKVIHPGFLLYSSVHSFAVLPEEQRFLINVRDERASPITVVLNWPSLLQR